MSRARSSTSCSRRAGLLGALGLLGGCGFRPIYAEGVPAAAGGDIASDLAATRVALIPDRQGQMLREALNQRLGNRSGAPARQELRVAISITRQAVGIRQDETASRLRASAVAAYILAPLPAGEPLTTGRSYAVDAFNIVNNQYFASQLSGEQVDRRLAERLAEDIVTQLAAFYARRAASGS